MKEKHDIGTEPEVLFRENEFDLTTAVLAGDQALELRLFTPHLITTSQEKTLTSRLCRLMDTWNSDWKR